MPIIQVPAIVEPHRGTAYNPPVEAHQELILKTYEAEEKRLQEADKLAEVKKMEEAHAVEPHKEGLAAGMKLTEKVLVEDDEAEEREEEGMVKIVPDRKTVAEE